MKITITVTERHIERGIGCEPGGCALAVAINEQIPTCEASVGLSQIGLQPLLPDRDKAYVELPLRAISFRQDFDLYEGYFGPKPRPISFEIEVPDGLVASERSREGDSVVLVNDNHAQPLLSLNP